MLPQRTHAGPWAAALAVSARVTGRRPSRRVAALAVLAVAATVLVASPAGAVTGGASSNVIATGATTGTVTAHVTLDGGGAAGYGCLDVSTRDYSSSGFQCGTGDISVPNLPAGEYLVGFTHFENGVDEWYRDAATRSAATPVSVVAGATTTISAALAVGGTIRGTVTLADGSAPSWGSAEAYDAEGRQVRLGTVGAAGAYSIGGLAPGSYYVRFSNFAGAPVTFVGGGDRTEATAVPVTSGSTTTLDYRLPEPATLEVTLDASAPHAPALSGPSMSAFTSSGDFLGGAERDGQTGAFMFDALPEGDIYLQFAPSTDHSFARVHYDGGVNTLGDATPVRVTAGTTSSTTFALHAVGALTGSVTRFNDRLATDPGLERDVVVYAQERAGGEWLPLQCTECGGAVEPLATVVTDATGSFTVDDLLVGDYKIGFRDHLDNAAYQPVPTDFRADPVTFYGGADLASAAVVHVTAGATVPNIHAVLQPVAGPPYVALAWGGGPLTCVAGQVVGAEFGWGYDSTSAGYDPAVEALVSRDGIQSVTLTQAGHPVTGNHDLVAGDLVIRVAVKDGYRYDPARLAAPGTTVNGNVVSFTWTIPPFVGQCVAPAPPSPPNPDAAIQAYVTQVYSDLFHRSPDPGGLATWTSALRSGTPYGQVANGITGSAEYRSGLIADTYRRYLGREPEAAGLAFWLQKMGSGSHIEQMQAGFIASDEFYARGGGTDRGWVALLYRTVLGRSPAPSEVDGWVSGIQRGMSRATVALGFLYSTEHLTSVVDGHYVHLLGRHIDPSGQATWVGQIQAGHRDEEIIASIVSSAEYRARF